MATYFVFGNAPAVSDLLGYAGKDETTDDLIKIEDSDVISGHYILTINGHKTGAQIERSGIITAIYAMDEDYEGVRLLTMLISQWNVENSNDEEDIVNIVSDDEMSAYLEFVS